MMIKCPRCGFSQPEDQYCAQCGVNMLSFRPKEKSFLKKLTENVGVQIIILVAVAVTAGSYFIKGSDNSKWGPKSDRLSGARTNRAILATQSVKETVNADKAETLQELTNKEITIATGSTESLDATSPSTSSLPKPTPTQADAAVTKSAIDTKSTAQDPAGTVLFKVTYAEVSRDVLQRWTTDSSNLGLFQNLQEYSAGILPDFNKRNDKITQYLKTTEKKLTAGQGETSVSGKVSDEDALTGLSVSYELKTVEAGTVHGTITVSRIGRQSRDRFPAEFDLPKGSAFFMIDTLTPQSFAVERRELNMAPFQIFKSSDFMTQNTKFVILIETVVK